MTFEEYLDSQEFINAACVFNLSDESVMTWELIDELETDASISLIEDVDISAFYDTVEIASAVRDYVKEAEQNDEITGLDLAKKIRETVGGHDGIEAFKESHPEILLNTKIPTTAELGEVPYTEASVRMQNPNYVSLSEYLQTGDTREIIQSALHAQRMRGEGAEQAAADEIIQKLEAAEYPTRDSHGYMSFFAFQQTQRAADIINEAVHAISKDWDYTDEIFFAESVSDNLSKLAEKMEHSSYVIENLDGTLIPKLMEMAKYARNDEERNEVIEKLQEAVKRVSAEMDRYPLTEEAAAYYKGQTFFEVFYDEKQTEAIQSIVEGGHVPESGSYDISTASDIIDKIYDMSDQISEYAAGYAKDGNLEDYAKLNAALKGLEEVQKEAGTLMHAIKRSLGIEEVGDSEHEKEKQAKIEI